MIAHRQEIIDLTDRARLEAEIAGQADELARLRAENEELRRGLKPPDRPELSWG